MSFIECILYGLISGFTEFLPVSAKAHQTLFRYLFGVSTRAPLQEFLVHIGVLLAVIFCCRETLSKLRFEQRANNTSRRRKSRSFDSKSLFEMRLLKTASVMLLAGHLLYIATAKQENNLISIMISSLFSAFVLFLADYTRRGNRDARTMSGLDGIVMGLAGSAAVFPGISRTGMIASYATVRGVENQSVASWAVLLTIPAMLFASCYDLVSIVSLGMGAAGFGVIIGYVFSGIAAFAAGYFGISLFKTLLNHSGFSGFGYYTVGVALFSFVLYLIA